MAKQNQTVCDFCGGVIGDQEPIIEMSFSVVGHRDRTNSLRHLMGLETTTSAQGLSSFLHPYAGMLNVFGAQKQTPGDEWKYKPEEQPKDRERSRGSWELCHPCGIAIVNFAIAARDEFVKRKVEGQ